MSDVEHTYVDTNNGWGGTALGAGFGGLIGSWFGNGMNGGWDSGGGAERLPLSYAYYH